MALSALFILGITTRHLAITTNWALAIWAKKNQIPHLLMHLCPIRHRFSIKKNSSNLYQQKQPSFIFPPFHRFSITYS